MNNLFQIYLSGYIPRLEEARSSLDWRLPAFTGELILENSLSFPKPQFSSL